MNDPTTSQGIASILATSQVFDELVAFYGDVQIHSSSDGYVCIHLGDETKGCTRQDFAHAMQHACQHLIADIELARVEALADFGFIIPEDELPKDPDV